MIITLMSFAMAISIFLIFSACLCSLDEKAILEIFVTPSISFATSAPKSFSTSSSVVGVSSTTSCRSAAQIASVSIPSSARIHATEVGWRIYGIPDTRLWSP